MSDVDFDRAPFIVIWETTQACDLACLHCRASAVPRRDPNELTSVEARRLIDTVRSFGRPLFVLTGGDPLKRPDAVELVRYAANAGLRVAMTPSGTPLMTPAGLSTQINTTIARHNLADLEPLIALMERLHIALWSVFFIVPTGRARPADLASAEEFEAVFHRLYELTKIAPFDIKTTAAPHYRRVVMQRQREKRRAGELNEPPMATTAGVGFSLADGVGRAKGVNDGDGFVFVSHRGEIYPSGFLPVSAGNVRTHELIEVYRTHELFRALRDRGRLKGKFGACEYRSVCGGSRARAYAMTGDWLEADPLCAYIPPAWRRQLAAIRGDSTPTT